MRFCFLLMLSLTLAGPQLYGQKKKVSGSATTEVGLNITTTLAGFFNSGGQNVPKDPYLFSIKRVKDNQALRMGINASFDVSDEGFSTGLRETHDNKIFLRIGKEWRQPVAGRFTLYYGADATGSWEIEKSKFSDFPGDLRSKDEQFGLGAGPVLGIIFQLHERVSLSTEAYVYGIYYTGEKYTDLGGPLPPEKSTISRFSMQPAIPNSLYVNFRF